jgi:hypothetical protein
MSIHDKAETTIVQVGDFDAFIAVLAQPPRLVARRIPEADTAHLRQNLSWHRTPRISPARKGFQPHFTRRHSRHHRITGVGTVRLVGTMKDGGALADVSIFTTGSERKTSSFIPPHITLTSTNQPIMAKFKITLNMEFCRSADKGFEAGVRIAPDWMDDDWAHHVMRYTLTKTEQAARRHKVFICIEPHDLFTHTTPGLLKVVNLVPSPWIQINWDTGNSYLAGMEDPYEGLEKVRNKVYHIHAKDISIQHSEAERGKVTGTPVGCACGEGVEDWERIAKIMEPVDREIFLSVECGKIDEAERSISFLNKALTKWLA